MARVSGKCPICGEIIHVNDEKISGHCGKCGAEISVYESIQLLRGQPDVATVRQREPIASQQKMDTRERTGSETPLRQVRRENRAQELEAKTRATGAVQTIRDMFQLCSSEQDYLMLRPKIMKMEITDSEKARLLEALDAATKERLKDVMKKAKDYEENQQSPLYLLVGCAVIIGVGLLINPIVGMIAIALSVIGVIGNMSERNNTKKIEENKAAAELIKQYRDLGYKI